MKNLPCLFTIVVIAIFSINCDDNKPPKTSTVNLAQPAVADTQQEVELGDGINIKFINGRGNHDAIERYVQHQMQEFINSGQYEIVQVSTTRCNRSEAHLLSAEIYYRVKNKQ